MMRAENVVIFDLDGTLVDSRSGAVRAITECLLDVGYPVPTERELVERFIGPDLYTALVEYCSPPGYVLDRMIMRFREVMLSSIKHIRAFPGIAGALAKLDSSEEIVAIALLTNRIQPFADSILSTTRLSKYFFAVSAANTLQAARGTHLTASTKSGRGVSLVANLRENNGPVNIILVGDRFEDWQVARKVGARFVRARWGYGSDEEFSGCDIDTCADLPTELPNCVLKSS